MQHDWQGPGRDEDGFRRLNFAEQRDFDEVTRRPWCERNAGKTLREIEDDEEKEKNPIKKLEEKRKQLLKERHRIKNEMLMLLGEMKRRRRGVEVKELKGEDGHQ